MKLKAHDCEGSKTFSGEIEPGQDFPPVDTVGSFSLEIRPGVWLNVRTSEWIVASLDDKPKTWPDAHAEHLESLKHHEPSREERVAKAKKELEEAGAKHEMRSRSGFRTGWYLDGVYLARTIVDAHNAMKGNG